MCQLPVHLCVQGNRWAVFTYNIELMRQQITMCPIKHSKMGLFYFLLFSQSFSLSFASCLLCNPPSPFFFISSIECVGLSIAPPPLCKDRWFVSVKKWTSPVKLVFCGGTDGSLCVPEGSRGLFMPYGRIHVYTHAHIYARVRGHRDCLCWSRMNFYEL